MICYGNFGEWTMESFWTNDRMVRGGIGKTTNWVGGRWGPESQDTRAYSSRMVVYIK